MGVLVALVALSALYNLAAVALLQNRYPPPGRIYKVNGYGMHFYCTGRPIWNRLQESLKALSPQSRRIIARGSRHHVMIDRPDVVIGAIRQVVTDVREHEADPATGTTVVE